ncbi:hypothetical protein C6T59_18645 [Burkholderia multivorans]|uniref:DUF2778 domain-containing protein n=1 Tax=Burkholderia multivorans TaxID=87883 RepID=UPI000CFF16DF|nr:DUF2778 domain-containing protein [Burkholderia multivorans]PRE96270.1 hypothetical protein C6Q01_28990 [Burkholderia multivorans]PRG64309.1 hypothetical protein C6T59_18645 [Burkholderia multivorans]
MPASCFYTLNKQNISALVCSGLGSMAAFSGKPGFINDPAAVAKQDTGPIPPGRYYIVVRQSGGHLGWLYDWLKDQASHVDHSQWFALYRADKQIDDFTYVSGVKRGNFRLHPNGRFGISEGCITLNSQADFNRLREFLLKQQTAIIPGTSLQYYGTVDVR